MGQCSKALTKKIMDRVSLLPTHILHHILTFLPAQDIVRTCVLSKQWKNIWCSLNSLDFGENLFSSKKIEFRNFVDHVLFLRDGTNLRKFHLFMEYEE